MHAQHSCYIYFPLICMHICTAIVIYPWSNCIHSMEGYRASPNQIHAVSKPYMANRVQQMLCRLDPMTYKSLSYIKVL